MSKIGKQPIKVISGVDVTYDSRLLTVKGPKGTLTRPISEFFDVQVAEGEVRVIPKEGYPQNVIAARWGLERALINNMITGVAKGFEETLELQGVGYKAVVKGNDLELSLGFSHTVPFAAPEGITFQVEKNILKVSGPDRELVGRIAANIRAIRPPEPYKGSGVRYLGEVIKLKAGKKAVASGG